MKRLGMVLMAAGVLAATHAIFTSAAPSVSSKPIRACVNRSGALRITARRACPRGSRPLTWNRPGARGGTGGAGSLGPAGAAGAKGDAGTPGPKGATGDAGDAGTKGVLGNSLDRANGMACHQQAGGAGTITVRLNAATGLEEFVCQ